MTVRAWTALPVAATLLAPLAVPAQEGQHCSEEREELEQTVQPAELNEQERAKYLQLMEAVEAFEEVGNEQECLITIGAIRRILFIYPKTADEPNLADQVE